LKVSIAGAKLSHLAQKNSMWDHGSMIEQVKAVFIYLKKAFLRHDQSIVKKCMTSEGFQKISKDIALKNWNNIIDAEIASIEIISVIPAKHNQADKFKALIKMKQASEEQSHILPVSFYKTNHIEEQEWLFVHQGGWWLLNEIKN